MEDLYEKMDNEMIEEIHDMIDDMGGELTHIDIDTKTIGIKIDPEIEEDANRMVDHIINRYTTKKKLILKEYPFYRAQLIQFGLNDEE